MQLPKERDQLILHTALTAGRIMIENGSEIERVEDTMTRIATNAGAQTSQLFVMITGILMAVMVKLVRRLNPLSGGALIWKRLPWLTNCRGSLPLRKLRSNNFQTD